MVLLASLVVLYIGFWPLDKIGSEFIPPLDEGDLMYMPTTYPGISIGKARELLQQTDKLIITVPEVKTVFGKAGRAETATDPAPITMIECYPDGGRTRAISCEYQISARLQEFAGTAFYVAYYNCEWAENYTKRCGTSLCGRWPVCY